MAVRSEPVEVWRKSSRSTGGSTGECVEVAKVWRKSSRSTGGSTTECVEVAVLTAR